MQYTQPQLAELYKKLPSKAQEAMMSEETADILRDIGEKRKLHIDQVGLIADEVGKVMLGITPRATFATSIMRRANLEKAVADDIASEVATKILGPIQTHLREATSGGADVVTLPPPSFEVKKSYVAASPSMAPASPPPTIPPTPPQTVAPPPAPGASTPRMATPTPQSDASPFLPVPETPATPPTPPSTPPPTPTTPEQKPPAPNIVGAKLGGVTYGAPSTEAKPTAPPSPAIDPYREPIE